MILLDNHHPSRGLCGHRMYTDYEAQWVINFNGSDHVTSSVSGERDKHGSRKVECIRKQK